MNEKKIQTIAMEEIWKSRSDGYLPVLIDIYNPDIKWNDDSLGQEACHFRAISDTNAAVYKGKKFLPCSFNVKVPEEDGEKLGTATITISTIDTRITQVLRSIDMKCEVTIEAFFAKQGTKIKYLPLDSLKATIPSANYNRSTATLQLVFKDALQINIPAEVATKDKLPSILES